MDPLERMPELVDHDMQMQVNGDRRGQLSTFTCPECGGSLWQVDEANHLRFRCHVGHAYYADSLLEEQALALEAALWLSVRTFRERAVLCRQLAAKERVRGNQKSQQRFDEEAANSERYADLIHQHLLRDIDNGNRESSKAQNWDSITRDYPAPMEPATSGTTVT